MGNPASLTLKAPVHQPFNLAAQTKIIELCTHYGNVGISILYDLALRKFGCQFLKAETTHQMIVHQPESLHVGIHGCAAHKLKSTLFSGRH